jgi:hypothetical protein
MDRTKIQRELEARTRKELNKVASELKIVGHHRMRKHELIEAIVLARMYEALAKTPGMLRRLTRKELLQLCEQTGIRAREGLTKADLLEKVAFALEKSKPPRMTFGNQEKVETAKFRTPTVPQDSIEDPGDLPAWYDETRVILLPVDPYLIHAYWDVASSDLEKAKRRLGRKYRHAQATLRFYDITNVIFDGTNPHSSFDVDIELQAKSRYVPLWSPEKSYCVDLALKAPDGGFYAIARSNVAETPRAWPSHKVEERYMLVAEDYRRVEPVSQSLGAIGQKSRKEGPSERTTEHERALPFDSAEISREKVTANYAYRQWSLPLAKPEVRLDEPFPQPVEESYLDLTEMSERKLSFGVSSKSLE